MSIIFNGTELKKVLYNGVECKTVIYNGVEVFSATPTPTPDRYFTFALNSTGTEYSIKAYNTADMPSTLVLPSTYNGKPVTATYDTAFRYCNLIESVVMPDSYTNLATYSFSSCNNLTQISLSSSLTNISGGAFSKCINLKSIQLPEKLTEVSLIAFRESGLTSIEMPDTVVKIGGFAFRNCSSLKTVTLDAALTSIGGNAFTDCTSLESITCKATTPPTINDSTFTNLPSTCIIHVPAESVNAYKTAANWSNLASQIQALP